MVQGAPHLARAGRGLTEAHAGEATFLPSLDRSGAVTSSFLAQVGTHFARGVGRGRERLRGRRRHQQVRQHPDLDDSGWALRAHRGLDRLLIVAVRRTFESWHSDG